MHDFPPDRPAPPPTYFTDPRARALAQLFAAFCAPRSGEWPASSDPYFALIYEAAHAWFLAYTNEFAFDQKASPEGVPTFDDPIKLRFGVWRPVDGRPCYYIVALSFDVLVARDGKIVRLEKMFIGAKMDPFPCLECYMQRDPETTEDADMELLFRWSVADGFEFWSVDEAGARVPLLMLKRDGAMFHVPVNTEASPPPLPAPAPSYLESLDPSVQAHLQGDLNFVCYRVDALTGAFLEPLWDIASMRQQLAEQRAQLDDHERRLDRIERHHLLS